MISQGDVNKIKIGSLSSIGDRSTVHVSSGSVNQKGAFPTTIGDKVTVGKFFFLIHPSKNFLIDKRGGCYSTWMHNS